MKPVKTIATASILFALVVSSAATAATAVVNVNGMVTNYTFAPEVSAEQQTGIRQFAGPLVGYEGQVVVRDYGSYLYDRPTRTRHFNYQAGSYDLSSTETIGMMLNPTYAGATETGLNAFEASRGAFYINENFDSSLPSCSGRDIRRASDGDDCFGAVENTELLRSASTINYGQLIGEASMTFGENGLMESLDYAIGGDVMTHYTESEGLDALLFGYYLTDVTLGLSNLTFDSQDGDILYFNADANVSVFIGSAPSEVPVPAAAWLFGSALMGLAGIKRRK